MIRFARQTLTLALFAVASLAALPPSAHASTVISGTIDGAEVLPEAAQVLRHAARWRREVQWHWDRAQRVGDGRTVAAIRRDFAIVQRAEQQARAALRTATTVVSVYGDAGARFGRDDIIALLRADGSYRYSHVHIWQRGGRILWDTRAPQGGYDDKRGGAGTSSATRPSGRSGTPRGTRPGSSPYGLAPAAKPPAGSHRGSGGLYGLIP